MTDRARTVFLGSGTFAVPIVAALAGHRSAELIAVVTAPARTGARGRPADSPVARWADERGIAVLRPFRLRAPAAVADITGLKPDLLVLADYGQIVPATLLELPPHGALNVHPSLLPRHRGASPIAAAILEGDRETGVSLMLMDAGLDTGPLIAQRRLELDGTEVTPALEATLANIAAGMLADALEPWLAGSLSVRPQVGKGASLTRPLRRENGRLDPSLPVTRLARQLRAFQPWPGSFVDTDLGRVVVWSGAPAGELPDVPRGTLVEFGGGRLGLVVGDGVLELVEVQPAGGRRMGGADLLRGRPGLVGSRIRPLATAPDEPSG